MRGVGRGGKTLFGQQRLERGKEAFLILFNGQQVVGPLAIKNLLGRRHLSMRRIGHHDLTDHVQFGHPPRNSTKFFATETLEQLRRDAKWLARASDAICAYWRQSNARKGASGRGTASGIKGSSGTAA